MNSTKRKLKELPIIGAIKGKLKVHYRKANNAYKKGNMQQAYNEIVNMQRIKPDDANVNHLLAIMLMGQQPTQVIFQYLNKAQVAAPDDIKIRKTYIDLLITSGQMAEALKQQQFIVSKESSNIDAWKQLLSLARKADDKVSLLEASAMLIELGHKDVNLKDIEYSLQNTLAKQYKTHVEKALLYVFEQQNTDFQKYMPHTATLLVAKYDKAELLKLTLQDLNDDVLLNAFLSSGYNVYLPFELWLSKVRRTIVSDIAIPMSADYALNLVQSIAIQGYLTGYIIVRDDKENQQLKVLESYFAESNDATSLLLISMYRAPTVQEITKAELLTRPQISDKFLKVFYHDQLAEQQYKQQIDKASSITNATSNDVRDMYEESPYPQWSNIDFHVSSPAALASELQLHSPHIYEQDNMEMLIAGCGTGRQSVYEAYRFKDVKIKAIDISSTSLAYALRKTKEYGLENIEYEQQDILKLGDSDSSYLMLESVGVLHHMQDPDKAFSIVREKLKPGGLMLIGLYSEIARKHINEIRELVKKKGIQSDLEEIRRFRHHNLVNANSHFINEEGIFELKDLGFLSGCRDLFFHVQEHQMSIPWIRATLAKHNLSFKGFTFSSENILIDFAHQYPHPEDRLNLDLWEKYETDNPDTFISMYNFYCQCNEKVN